MRILILTDLFKNGGMETHILSYIGELRQEHEYYLCANEIDSYIGEKQIFSRLRYVDFSGINLESNLKKVKDFCIENKIEMIHAHTNNTYVFAAIISQRLRIPYILTIHGPGTLNSTQSILHEDIVKNIAIKNANYVYVVSEELKNLVGLYKQGSLEVMHNAINTEMYKYKNRDHGYMSNKWALVSRLDYDKVNGIKEAINYLSLYGVEELDIYGNGSAYVEIEDHIKDMNSIKVSLKGYLPEVNQALEDGYTGIIGMGRALLEGLAMGYPGLLLGYEGIKGFVKKDNFDDIAFANFSGRNMSVLTQQEMIVDFELFKQNPHEYDFGSRIEENYNIKSNIKSFNDKIKKIVFEENRDLLRFNEIILTNPADYLIYNNSQLLVHYFEAFYGTDNKLLLYKLMEQNNRAYESIIKLETDNAKKETENKVLVNNLQEIKKEIEFNRELYLKAEANKVKIEYEKHNIVQELNKLQEEVSQLEEKAKEIEKVKEIEKEDLERKLNSLKQDGVDKLNEQNNTLKVSLQNTTNEVQRLNDLLYLSNVKSENLNAQLWQIHSSTFWKVATKYYYLRDNTVLKYPFKAARKIKRKLKGSEPVVSAAPVAAPAGEQASAPTVVYEHKVTHEKDRSVFIFAGVAYYDIGGGQRSAQLAKTFYKMGYDVHYIYAYDSSEIDKVTIDLPVKVHMSIDELSQEYVKKNLGKETFFIFEIPHDKFYPYLNQANLLGVKTVYEHIDNWETSLGGDWFHLDIYRDFLKQSDVLVATAALLREKLQETVDKEWPELNKEVHYLANAVDCELFESLLTHKKPKDLVKGEKTLLYYGSLWGEWFDWNLVFGVAEAFPSYTINLIGEYEGVIKKFNKIPSNVHFLGLKKQVELPAYLQHSDYAILPFETCEIGKYVSPLKIFEYICMNKVVLSTKLPDVDNYPNVYYGDTPEEWIEILKQKPEPTQSNAEFVNQHNWYNRCNAMVEALGLTKHYEEKISVIILNRNNKKVIFRCVDSLLINNKYGYEVIVVDNDSTDGSYEQLLEQYNDHENVKIIKNDKNGCSSGRNLGVRHATGDYVVFLDSDQWVWGTSWLDKGLDILHKDKNIGAVGWAAGWFSEGSVGGPICDYLPNRGVEKNELYRMDVAYIGTGGMVLQKKLYDAVKGFDEYYDPTCYEDTDFALSIKNLGFDLAYCPYMTIFHLPHQTTNSGSKAHQELMTRNGNYFKEKWEKENQQFLKIYLNN